MTKARVAVLIALGALLLAASYPPLALPFISFVALTPAVLLLVRAEVTQDPRRAFRWGFWYGVAAHGLVLYWMIVALWHFTPLSALGYLATIAALALWTAVLFWFTVRVRLALPQVPLWIVFPIAWTAVEWAVGHQGDIRFPWLGLGTSLADAPVLVQWADIAGARGVTVWLVWCSVMMTSAFLGDPANAERGAGNAERSGALGRAFRVPRSAFRAGRYLAPVVATVVLAFVYGSWRQRTIPIRALGTVALIQPNVGFDEKWERPRQDSIVGQLLAMSRAPDRHPPPDLITWPEAAIPGYLQQRASWDSAIAQLARELRTPIFTGGLYAVFSGPNDYQYYNAAFFFDSTGAWRSYPVYAKHYLVPIVERVPFLPPRWFGNLQFFGGFGRGRDLPLYRTSLGRFGTLICYESAFEDLPRRYRQRGADFLVNITNDAWFGRTSAPYQHASHLVLRAIETRAGIARAANSGISEFVDPLGRAYATTRLESDTIIVDTLRTSDVMPLYVRLGDWVGWLAVLATLGLAGGLLVHAWNSSRQHS